MKKLKLKRTDTYEGYLRNIYEPTELLTVKDFLNILSNEVENAIVIIKERGRTQTAKYHKLIYINRTFIRDSDSLPDDVYSCHIRSIQENVDKYQWNIFLANEEELAEEIVKHNLKTKEERVNERIKSMSTRDLQRYILEAQARKLMMEEADE